MAMIALLWVLYFAWSGPFEEKASSTKRRSESGCTVFLLREDRKAPFQVWIENDNFTKRRVPNISSDGLWNRMG